MSIQVPEGHYLVCYDYGMGGLWWIVKADSATEIRNASSELTVFEQVPSWMSKDELNSIENDNLSHPKSEVLRRILSGVK